MQSRNEILNRATDVFCSEEKAKRWLQKPCRALGGSIPAQILNTPEGAELVLAELVRIDHGVYY